MGGEGLEGGSRGQASIRFDPQSKAKRVLISGFDPFGMDRKSVNGKLNHTILDSNPSGAAALALDGQTVSGPHEMAAQVEGVTFPVRYRDFDQGRIEQLFAPYLNGTHPVSMIMTISQGDRNFDIEEFAGRRRSSGLFADNEGATTPGTRNQPLEPPGLSAGPEFLRTQLPHAAMSTVPQTGLHREGWSQTPGLPHLAIAGSGGGFLSNEIFYRLRLLQTNLQGSNKTLPVGHLHLPSEDELPVTDIVARVRSIIAASLPSI